MHGKVTGLSWARHGKRGHEKMRSNTKRNIASKLNLASVGKPALAGAFALVVMVAVVAGRIVIDTATASVFEIEPAGDKAEQTEEPGQAVSEGRVKVHVAGCVAAPGVVVLAEGSRVADAVAAAGGLSEGAAADAVNLARVIQDGEQVLIPTAEQATTGSACPQGTDGDAGGQQGAASDAGVVNINTAGTGELQSLPGIGPSTAAKIVEDRKANGPFKSRDDLKRVSGIGEKKYEGIADLICV